MQHRAATGTCGCGNSGNSGVDADSFDARRNWACKDCGKGQDAGQSFQGLPEHECRYPLTHFERIGKSIRIEFDDIDSVEQSMDHCLVGFFMGRHLSRQGVELIAKRCGVPSNFHLHTS